MKPMSKKVMKHLKEDIHEEKEAAAEDRGLLKEMKAKYMKKKCTHSCKTHKKESSMKRKVKKVMHEYGEGKLHSGSKKGPVVKNRRQAVAIAMSEGRKAEGKAISRTMKKHKRK